MKARFLYEFYNRLLMGVLTLCLDCKTFHLDIDHLKTILRKNNYPPNLIDSCIKSYINKLYTPKVIAQNVLRS